MPRRIIAVTLLLTFGMASCRTWTAVQGIPNPMPEAVRVELLSGEQVEVIDARLEADTLVGRLPGGDESVRVPLAQIASIEAGQTQGGWGLALLVVAVPSVGILTGLAFKCC